MTPMDSYLASAGASGFLYETDGCRLVAGRLVEPVTNAVQCFVEYCDPAGYTTTSALQKTISYIADEFPDVDVVIFRVRGSLELEDPWRLRVTYVRYVGPHSTDSKPEDIDVYIATAADDDLVREWITDALLAGYACQYEQVPDRGDVVSAATDVLQSPGRLSLLAAASGRAVGHVTMLDDVDEVTDELLVDLFDLLVVPGKHQGIARSALVEAAVKHSRKLGKPLIGNVTHSLNDPSDSNGRQVLAQLLDQGWAIDSADWQLTLT
jgi:predicted N-acetyltransferase YhbS